MNTSNFKARAAVKRHLSCRRFLNMKPTFILGLGLALVTLGALDISAEPIDKTKAAALPPLGEGSRVQEEPPDSSQIFAQLIQLIDENDLKQFQELAKTPEALALIRATVPQNPELSLLEYASQRERDEIANFMIDLGADIKGERWDSPKKGKETEPGKAVSVEVFTPEGPIAVRVFKPASEKNSHLKVWINGMGPQVLSETDLGKAQKVAETIVNGNTFNLCSAEDPRFSSTTLLERLKATLADYQKFYTYVNENKSAEYDWLHLDTKDLDDIFWSRGVLFNKDAVTRISAKDIPAEERKALIDLYKSNREAFDRYYRLEFDWSDMKVVEEICKEKYGNLASIIEKMQEKGAPARGVSFAEYCKVKKTAPDTVAVYDRRSGAVVPASPNHIANKNQLTTTASRSSAP